MRMELNRSPNRKPSTALNWLTITMHTRLFVSKWVAIVPSSTSTSGFCFTVSSRVFQLTMCLLLSFRLYILTLFVSKQIVSSKNISTRLVIVLSSLRKKRHSFAYIKIRTWIIYLKVSFKLSNTIFTYIQNLFVGVFFVSLTLEDSLFNSILFTFYHTLSISLYISHSFYQHIRFGYYQKTIFGSGRF